MNQWPSQEDSEWGPLLTLQDIFYSGGVLHEMHRVLVGIRLHELLLRHCFFVFVLRFFFLRSPLHLLTIDN